MLRRLAGGTTPRHVAACYEGLIDALVIDVADAAEPAGVRTIATDTLMSGADGRRRVGGAALGACPAGGSPSSAGPATSALRSRGSSSMRATMSSSAREMQNGRRR